jgi:hypothetical protein
LVAFSFRPARCCSTSWRSLHGFIFRELIRRLRGGDSAREAVIRHRENQEDTVLAQRARKARGKAKTIAEVRKTLAQTVEMQEQLKRFWSN